MTPTAANLAALEELFGLDIGALSRAENVASLSGEDPSSYVSHRAALPARLRPAAQRFEREVIRLGASDFEVDYIASVLASPENAKLFHMGEGGKPLTPEEQEAEFEIQLEALKLWVTRRIERRRGA